MSPRQRDNCQYFATKFGGFVTNSMSLIHISSSRAYRFPWLHFGRWRTFMYLAAFIIFLLKMSYKRQRDFALQDDAIRTNFFILDYWKCYHHLIKNVDIKAFDWSWNEESVMWELRQMSYGPGLVTGTGMASVLSRLLQSPPQGSHFRIYTWCKLGLVHTFTIFF